MTHTQGIQTWESPATADGGKLGLTVTTGTVSNEIVHLKDTPEFSYFLVHYLQHVIREVAHPKLEGLDSANKHLS